MLPMRRELFPSLPDAAHALRARLRPTLVPRRRGRPAEARRLRTLVMLGFAARVAEDPDRFACTGAYLDRLESELELWALRGGEGLLLRLAELARTARAAGLRLLPGAGATPSSAAVWALGGSDVDPVAGGLYVECLLGAHGLPELELALEPADRDALVELAVDRLGGALLDDPGRARSDALPLAFPALGTRPATLIEAHARRVPLVWLQALSPAALVDGLSSSERAVVARAAPASADEWAALLALARPAAVADGRLEAWLRARETGAPAAAPPLAGPELEPTLGVPVFQEQLVALLARLTGWTVAEARAVERELARRRPLALARLAPGLRAALAARGVDEAGGRELWAWLVEVAGRLAPRAPALARGQLALQTPRWRRLAGR